MRLPNRGRFVTLAALVCSTLFVTVPTHAQSAVDRARYSAGLMAGVTQFDLSGTGTASILTARGDVRLTRWLLAEGALGMFRPNEQFGRTRTYVAPEVQLQFQIPARAVQPYLGVGVGSVHRGSTDLTPSVTEVSYSGATGLRIPVQRVDLRGELRVRGIGRGLGATTADWTFGAAYRF